MKIVSPSIEIMRTGLETEVILPEQFIEKVGRTCYKSEDKITNDSAAKFVSNLIKRGHEAMIEHWSLIFKMDYQLYQTMVADWNELMYDLYDNPSYLRPHLRFSTHYSYLVSGNMRAWRDFVKAFVHECGIVPEYLYGLIRNYPLFFPEFQDYVPAIIVNNMLTPVSVSELSDKERQIHQDVTVKVICDRGVTHEIVRHRVGSYAQESTRYCNYGLEKFGRSIAVAEPRFIKNAYESGRHDIIRIWEEANVMAEKAYFDLLNAGCTPQEARCILPTDLKAEIIVTMNLDGWNHFLELRDATTAHPDMREVAHMVKCQFEVDGII